MIGYLQFRREAKASYETPSLRVWLISTGYQIKARLLHRLGRHTYRIRWTGRPWERHSVCCRWCGHRRNLGAHT